MVFIFFCLFLYCDQFQFFGPFFFSLFIYTFLSYKVFVFFFSFEAVHSTDKTKQFQFYYLSQVSYLFLSLENSIEHTDGIDNFVGEEGYYLPTIHSTVGIFLQPGFAKPFFSFTERISLKLFPLKKSLSHTLFGNKRGIHFKELFPFFFFFFLLLFFKYMSIYCFIIDSPKTLISNSSYLE